MVYPAQAYREEQLWNHEIAGLLKKYEAQLRGLVSLYADRPHHDTSARVLTLGDVIQLFTADSSLKLREKDVVWL